MKRSTQHAFFGLALTGLLAAVQASAVTIEFISGEGYVDGDL